MTTTIAALAVCCSLTLMAFYVMGRIPASDYWLPW
jgi:hypothetical protein